MSSNTGFYFAQFPKNFDKLRAVLVAGKDIHVGRKSSLGPRQFYREIIFTEADLLIAPDSEENVVSEKAVVIAEGHLFESGKVNNTLQKFALEQEASIPVTRGLFLYCLVFVLTHRLAPLWNKIDKYFLQGRDFLADDTKIPAIQAEFCLTDKITLAVKACLVKLPKPKKALTQYHDALTVSKESFEVAVYVLKYLSKRQLVDDFGVSPNILQKFYQSEEFSIHGYSLENNKCLVLPSLKTGYITCISHRDFEGIDFKRYWKIIYGFRLPVQEPKKDIYYQIRFPTSGLIFSYPECCIRHKEAQISVRCEHKAIFKSFLEDLMLRMPSVCGSPLTFTSSTLYPTSILHLASVSKQTNLTKAATLSKANQPFTHTKKTGDISNTQTITKPDRSNHIVRSNLGAQSDGAMVGQRGVSLQKAGQTSVERAAENIGNQYQESLGVTALNTYDHDPQAQSYPTARDNSQDTGRNSLEVTSLARKPYVPVFTKHKSVQELTKKTTLPKDGELRKEKPLVPCFKKNLSKSKLSTTSTKVHIKPCPNGKAKVACASGSKVTMPSIRNVENILSASVGSQINRSPWSNDNATASRLSLSLNRKRVDSGILNTEKIGGKEAPGSLSGASEQRIDSHMVNETNSQFFVEQHQPVAQQSIEPQKKSTKAPKHDVDVRKMVAENKLSKVSAAAITKWLKSEGVKCKCKEKKQDLMLKVYQYLDLVQPEP